MTSRRIVATGKLLMTCMIMYTASQASATGLASPNPEPEKKSTYRAAIVIDDFGNGLAGTEDMLKVPYPLTAAVMPFLRSTEKDAIAAHKAGFDVLVHLPMEPKTGKLSWLGPGAIMTGLSDDEIRSRVRKAIDAVPFAIGINNHTGSKATGDMRVMRLVMEVCKERGFVFLDSHTNYRSVACRAAREYDVPCLENGIFLDDRAVRSHIAKQLNTLAERAKSSGQGIAIGHVGHGNTLAGTLHNMLPQLASRDQITFVGISKLFPVKTPRLAPFPSSASEPAKP